MPNIELSNKEAEITLSLLRFVRRSLIWKDHINAFTIKGYESVEINEITFQNLCITIDRLKKTISHEKQVP